jgi:hypothetical protein
MSTGSKERCASSPLPLCNAMRIVQVEGLRSYNEDQQAPERDRHRVPLPLCDFIRVDQVGGIKSFHQERHPPERDPYQRPWLSAVGLFLLFRSTHGLLLLLWQVELVVRITGYYGVGPSLPAKPSAAESRSFSFATEWFPLFLFRLFLVLVRVAWEAVMVVSLSSSPSLHGWAAVHFSGCSSFGLTGGRGL